jgi:hypothetical protein
VSTFHGRCPCWGCRIAGAVETAARRPASHPAPAAAARALLRICCGTGSVDSAQSCAPCRHAWHARMIFPGYTAQCALGAEPQNRASLPLVHTLSRRRRGPYLERAQYWTWTGPCGARPRQRRQTMYPASVPATYAHRAWNTLLD